jgi:hypothetical protein
LHFLLAFFYSALADYLFICSADFGVWGVPNKHLYFCPFAAQNTMLAIFHALSCVFSPEHFFSAQDFAVYQRISRQSFVGDFFFFSKAILSLFGAVIAQFGRQFDENYNL